MKTQYKISLVALIILFLILSSSILILRYNPIPVFREDISDNTVVRIIDGDTFELASGDIVRLLCIDTPEIGEEESEMGTFYLTSLILNKEVILESDVQDKDDYGRLLRYVYVNASWGTVFINRELYQNGYAKMMIIPPSDSRCEEISYIG